MAMAQAAQTVSRASYRRRAAAFQNARTVEMPLFQAFLCFSHQGTTDCRCIKDGTPIDPCMGSGHILVYMFEVLKQIYTSSGYSEHDVAKSILEHNICVLDIDDRAYQLAYFAVMMKVRQYNRRILTNDI